MCLHPDLPDTDKRKFRRSFRNQKVNILSFFFPHWFLLVFLRARLPEFLSATDFGGREFVSAGLARRDPHAGVPCIAEAPGGPLLRASFFFRAGQAGTSLLPSRLRFFSFLLPSSPSLPCSFFSFLFGTSLLLLPSSEPASLLLPSLPLSLRISCAFYKQWRCRGISCPRLPNDHTSGHRLLAAIVACGLNHLGGDHLGSADTLRQLTPFDKLLLREARYRPMSRPRAHN